MKFVNIATESRGMTLHSMGLNYIDVSKLRSRRHELAAMLFLLPNEQWIRENVTFKNEVVFLQALLNNELIYVANGSFFQDRSNLMSVA